MFASHPAHIAMEPLADIISERRPPLRRRKHHMYETTDLAVRHDRPFRGSKCIHETPLPRPCFPNKHLVFICLQPICPVLLCVSINLYDEERVSTEQELRQKLRKIAALFEGATTVGEQDAAAAAIERVRAALKAAEQKEKSVETVFRLPDRWSRLLFTALCRRHGMTPYRYPRQRYSTVVLRAPASFINNVLWPEFLEIKSALDEYLNEATERIIREEVFRVSEEAEERVS